MFNGLFVCLLLCFAVRNYCVMLCLFVISFNLINSSCSMHLAFMCYY